MATWNIVVGSGDLAKKIAPSFTGIARKVSYPRKRRGYIFQLDCIKKGRSKTPFLATSVFEMDESELPDLEKWSFFKEDTSKFLALPGSHFAQKRPPSFTGIARKLSYPHKRRGSFFKNPPVLKK